MPGIDCATSEGRATGEISAAGDRASRAGRALTALAGPDGWERRIAGSGAHRERLHDWTVLVLDPAGLPEGWGHWLLVRRPITPTPGADPELAFHPAPARPAHPAPEPVGVAGARWAVASGHGSDGFLRLVDHLRAG